MLQPVFKQDDKKANLIIWIVSIVVCGAVVFLTNFKPLQGLDLGFNVHLLALVNAVINGTVSVLLVLALIAVKSGKMVQHKNLMLVAIVLSSLFLVSYIGHHLLSGETKFGSDTFEVRFAIRVTSLTNENEAYLNKLIQAGKIKPGQPVMLLGYADYRGTPAHNDTVSAERAGSVQAYLLSKGFSKSDITLCTGKGQIQRPGMTGVNGYAPDRKVQIVTQGGPHDGFYFFYLFILITHIFLATVILPFILFTAYRALSGDYQKHKKLARYTWPLWLYVSITGVLVYWLISPYYVPHL